MTIIILGIALGQIVCTPRAVAQEIQVPLDNEGNVNIITSEVEQRFGLFREYENFVEARLFQLSDSSYSLEITQLLSGKQQRTRTAVTAAQVSDLRARVSLAVRNGNQFASPELYMTDWEKTSLAIGTGFLGLYYGLALDAAVASSTVWSSQNSFQPSFSTWTLAAPLAFAGGGLWVTQQPWFTRSSALMMGTGLTTGFFHGLALYAVAGDYQNTTPVVPLGLAALSGIVEAGVGLRLSEQLGLSYGQTVVLSSAGGSGLFAGICLPAAFGAFDGGNNAATALRLTGASVLSLSAAGYYAGYQVSQSQHFAPGDGTVFSTPAGIAGLLPLSLGFLNLETSRGNSANIDWKLLAGLSVVTNAAGYWLGSELIKGKDFTFDQGRAISQASGWGALAGLVVLLADRTGAGIRYYPLVATVGSAIGFGIDYANNAKQAEQNDRNRRAATGEKALLYKEHSENSWFDHIAKNVDIEWSPLGVIALASPNVSSILASSTVSLPIVNIRYTPESPSMHEHRQYEQIKHEQYLNPNR